MISASERPKFVLLTGGSGYVGHKVLDELLQAGYKVRATCRPPKVPILQSCFPNAGDQLEIAVIEDLVEADWKEHFQGINAVIHVAGPVFRPGVTSKEIYDTIIVGTQRLLQFVCQSKNVKHFVYTGTVGAFFQPDWSNIFQDIVFDETTFLDIDDIDPNSARPDATYIASKAIAEKRLWEVAEKHSHIDFSVVLLPCVYGRFLDTYPSPRTENGFNANKFLYSLIKDNAPFPPYPSISQVNLRDAARVHIHALSADRVEIGRKKRLIITSGNMPWDQAVDYLKEKRPELKDRLPDVTRASLPPHHFRLDTRVTKEVLGLGEQDLISWQDTLLEVIDWVVEWEKEAVSQN